MDTKVKGSKELVTEVIDAGLCTLCGACAGGCPYLMSYRGRMVLLDNCTLSEGQCYQCCPRTYTDMDAISQEVFGMPYNENETGITKEVMIARSTDSHITERAQYGGTVTALLSLAMTEGLIDSAILARMSEDKKPHGFLAQSPEEILHCAGSSYAACPVLETYNQIPRDNKDKLGIVATPCQVLAISKMKKEPPEDRFDIGNVKLVIGLFCTWALSSDEFDKFLNANLDLSEVRKFDIPPPPASSFDVYTSSEKISFPLDQIRELTMPTCAYCLDMTAEFADISVGSAEGIDGWNTVIVRTKAGAELIEMAKAKGVLETAILPPENLAHLKEAALLKKKRALRNIIARTGNQENLLYLGLSKNIVNAILV